MIIEETLHFEGKTYIKHKSDKFFIIQEQTGIEYASAIDLAPCRYTYVESAKLRPIETEPAPLEAEDTLEIKEL